MNTEKNDNEESINMVEGYGLFEEEKLKVRSTRRMKMEEGGIKEEKEGEYVHT